MNFEEYQSTALRTAKPGALAFQLTHAAMGLSGEAGEFVDAIKRHVIYGRTLDEANAKEELGDILWFVALGAQALGVGMEELARGNISKLQLRYPEKYSDLLAQQRLDK